MTQALPPATSISWTPSYRLIPSRYPTVGLFDAVADPADLEAVFAIESLTNERLRDAVGDIALVAPHERVTGPGATLIMAAFTHCNPAGSRFTDGTFGVYYAGESFDTALAEVSYHRTQFLAATQEPEIDIDLRLVLADVQATLHDVRSGDPDWAAVCDRHAYGASQALAARLLAVDSWGVIYPSQRRAGGECVAILRPRALTNARASRHVGLHWDGIRFTHWYEKSDPASFA